jgi:acyl-CoA synthetase (AMP-forming)/AMP-acid ligase II
MDNVFLQLLDHLEDSNKPVFYDNDYPISGKQYRNLIISFALHMKKHGVTQSSVVALDVYGVVVGTALSVACGLIGCSWIKYSIDSAKAADELKLTHVFHESPLQVEVDIPCIELDNSWNKAPEGIDPNRHMFFSYDDENKPFLIAHSSGTTGNVKFIPISYREYFERVHNNFDIQFQNARYGCFLFQPLKSTTQYKAVALMLNDIPIVHNMTYEQLSKYPRVHIIGSHGQFDFFIRGKEPPTKPYKATADLSGSATTVKYLENIFKHVDQVNIGYGATETSRTANKRLYSVADFNGSSGYPFDDVEFKIEPDGTVLVKTPRSYDEDGDWFAPGDLGYMENGELFITGRKKEQINVGGVKIDPVSIEEEIRKVDGVYDCMVFQDDRQHVEYQLSVLIVAEKNRAVAIDVHAACKEKFGMSKIPQNLYYVDELPKTEGGKVSRKLAIDIVKEFKHTKYVYVLN